MGRRGVAKAEPARPVQSEYEVLAEYLLGSSGYMDLKRLSEGRSKPLERIIQDGLHSLHEEGGLDAAGAIAPRTGNDEYPHHQTNVRIIKLVGHGNYENVMRAGRERGVSNSAALQACVANGLRRALI